jgi:DNA-binding beta-propeller fold protein YncE
MTLSPLRLRTVFGITCIAALALAADPPFRPEEKLPQLYRTERDWGEFSDRQTVGVQGIVWPAAVTAVESDRFGHIYVIYRCHENSCTGRTEDPILKFDRNGKLLGKWGSGMFVFPHGGTVDPQGNLWVADAGAANGIGNQIFKFSPEGKVLMTIGQKGATGSGHDTFNQPTDVAIAPNGDVFIADGHRDSNTAAIYNSRIVHFSKDGKYIGEFGKPGTGQGEMREPHSIAFDSRGRLFVADRVNNRIQIFDQSGKYLDTWTQFGRPSGIAISADDTIYVADSESGPDTGAKENFQFRKGIRIGSARTGKVASFIEDQEPIRAEHSGAEGVGVDAEGNVWGAVVRRKMLEKHILVSKSMVPKFEVDPFWPKPLPNHWVLGQTIGVTADDQDHIWIVHRQGSLEPGEVHATTNPPISNCCTPAPPVLEFDQAGNLLHAWGGPGEGYDWPISNHGVTVDYKGFVWIGGNGAGPEDAQGAKGGEDRIMEPGAKPAQDNQILKFTKDGKFVMQIGKPWQSKGSNDTQNLRLASKIFVDPKRNEAYVSDGYLNHRVIVFDADTGQYKRHWGAYGNKPSDVDPGPYVSNQVPAKQFRNPVHCVVLSKDDLLYVCDRQNDRIQVFRPDGTFVREAFFETTTLGSGSLWDMTLSPDPEQRFIYASDGENRKVRIIDRKTLEVLYSFGDGGQGPGQFYGVHSIATDSKGNIYTTETYRGQRVQRFNYKGLVRGTVKDIGVPWPGAMPSPTPAAAPVAAAAKPAGAAAPATPAAAPKQ